MAYIRYKEVTKHFNFSSSMNIKKLPLYVTDYVSEGETLIAAYKVGRDHGIFTDKKIVLFDNSLSFRPKKEITIIPYKSVSAHTIIFRSNEVLIYLLLDSGYPLLLTFVNTDSKDKVKLRYIYNVMSNSITGIETSNEMITKLLSEDFDIIDRKENIK